MFNKWDFKFENFNIKGSFKSYEKDSDKEADGEAKDTWYQEVAISCIFKTNEIGVMISDKIEK